MEPNDREVKFSEKIFPPTEFVNQPNNRPYAQHIQDREKNYHRSNCNPVALQIMILIHRRGGYNGGVNSVNSELSKLNPIISLLLKQFS